jgi:Cu(I)/Ag(I) efflux system protein CusF
MKHIATLSILAALTVAGPVLAQTGDVKGMGMKGCTNMKGMDMKGMDMKGMDMKGMDMIACKGMMTEMDSGSKTRGTSPNGAVHKTAAVVKAIDPAAGTVTLAHDPVKSLKWPAMTMGFKVKDKTLFDKLAVGKKVDVEFTRQGSDYVVTVVK